MARSPDCAGAFGVTMFGSRNDAGVPSAENWIELKFDE
jgi:hypothetical protein